MSDGSRNDEVFIHFTPRVPDSWDGPGALDRRPVNGTGRSPLPPEALGGWPEQTAPARAVSRGRGSRPRPAVAAVGPRSAVPAPRAVASSGAGAERRDMRSAYQDEWLNAARKAGRPLEVIFANGSALSGRLVNFDTYALIMEHEGATALVFKHAVMLVRPQTGDGEAEASAGGTGD